MANSVQTLFLPLDKLITWLSALKGIIAAFGADFVCDENNSKFSSVIEPMDRCNPYRFLLIRHQIQMK